MIKIIAAVSVNGVIGKNNTIPWRLRSDMNWFKKVTGNSAVLMGSNTYFSLPERFRPLPGRTNIVLSNHPEKLEGESVVVFSSFKQAVDAYNSEDLFVIGGQDPYRVALHFADELYLTRVHAEMEGDAFFPEWSKDDWQLTWAQDNQADDLNEFNYSWEIYLRKQPPRRTEHPYVEIKNCPTDEQRRVYEEIIEAEHCPFCPENLSRWHKPRIILEGDHWIVGYRQWPYPDTEIHLMLFLKEHSVDLASLPTGAGEEYFKIIQWMEKEFNTPGGITWMRFGEPATTGATIRHLHAQFMVPHPKAKEPTKIYVG